MGYGSCAVTRSTVFLCFPHTREKTCFKSSSPLGQFTNSTILDSTYDHYRGLVSASEGLIFTAGDMYHTKTELYNLDSDSWEERASYPFNSQIYDAVPIYYKGEFILF